MAKRSLLYPKHVILCTKQQHKLFSHTQRTGEKQNPTTPTLQYICATLVDIRQHHTPTNQSMRVEAASLTSYTWFPFKTATVALELQAMRKKFVYVQSQSHSPHTDRVTTYLSSQFELFSLFMPEENRPVFRVMKTTLISHAQDIQDLTVQFSLDILSLQLDVHTS